MTVTYPLAWPGVARVRSIRLRQRTVVAATRSPFTGHRQVQVHAGQWWEADITLPPLRRATAEAWLAWIVSLNGTEGTFLMGDTANAAPRGTARFTPGTPLVMGGGQAGGSLTFDGAPASAPGYLLAGDWIQVGSGAGSRLHKVLADADTNGAGEVTVDIWPRLRAAPADNSPVVLVDTRGVFSLPAGTAADWTIDMAIIYGLSFSAIEAL
ncbi:hypothetical protein FHP25_35865 [Vineibacter terrae]|uniref:Uncharacterized protein n=1 Tax=Vineibacter terrae TaxID=2586908 RepID=A0A5C8P8X4_9HYPH|nr:hypothetical protein [Vineibacter terrae]TXL70101.1 hypothetical protein FHP25_35865 [Vineibacter terrae]